MRLGMVYVDAPALVVYVALPGTELRVQVTVSVVVPLPE